MRWTRAWLINPDLHAYRLRVVAVSAAELLRDRSLWPLRKIMFPMANTTSAENLSLQFRCSNLGCYSVRFGIACHLWMVNFFDAERAKAHFEWRQQSRCRPDSPSTSSCASIADSDGVRHVRRPDRWLPPLIECSRLATFNSGLAARTVRASTVTAAARVAFWALAMEPAEIPATIYWTTVGGRPLHNVF